MAPQTYYDILEIDRTAEASEIRKAYLKASLKHHPDKNPDNVEAAKAKFIGIGQAYETLSDPQQRAAYDRALRGGGGGGAGAGAGAGASSNFSMPTSFDPSDYDNYQNAFDATVAGMSEAELAAAVGAVTVVASLVGSMVGSRMVGGNKSGGRGLLEAAGSMVGSMVASEMAASSVRALHQESVQRLQYKEECRRAVERGAPMPDPPPASKWGEVLQKTMDTVKGVTQSAGGNDNTRQSLGDLWKQAQAGMKAASQNSNVNSGTSSSYR